MPNRILTKVLIVLTVIACLLVALPTEALAEVKRFRAEQDRPTQVSFGRGRTLGRMGRPGSNRDQEALWVQSNRLTIPLRAGRAEVRRGQAT